MRCNEKYLTLHSSHSHDSLCVDEFWGNYAWGQRELCTTQWETIMLYGFFSMCPYLFHQKELNDLIQNKNIFTFITPKYLAQYHVRIKSFNKLLFLFLFKHYYLPFLFHIPDFSRPLSLWQKFIMLNGISPSLLLIFFWHLTMLLMLIVLAKLDCVNSQKIP